MNYFTFYGLIALTFQLGFSSNLNAEPAVPSVVLEEAKFDKVWWETAWLKLEKADADIPVIKTEPEAKTKSQRKISELDMKLKAFRVMSSSA